MEEPTPVGKVLKALALALVVLVVAFPLYVVVLTSFSTESAVAQAGGLVIVPHGITFGAYTDLFAGGVVTRSVIVSTAITAVGTLLSVTVTVMAAYGLSRPNSFGHRPLLFVILLTFLFGPGIIPTYLLVQSLGLLDNYWSLILPGAVAAFNVVVMRSFFMNSIPQEVIESARLDGASEFRILRQYVLQGQPIPGVSAVQQAQANSLTGAVPTLAVKMAVITLAVVPIMLVYPFVQRHFTKGVIIGAVKG
jgi:putative aldouronate transport system permease protein